MVNKNPTHQVVAQQLHHCYSLHGLFDPRSTQVLPIAAARDSRCGGCHSAAAVWAPRGRPTRDEFRSPAAEAAEAAARPQSGRQWPGAVGDDAWWGSHG